MKEFYNNLLYLVLGITIGAFINGSTWNIPILVLGCFMILLLITKITLIDIQLKSNKLVLAERSFLTTVIPFCSLTIVFLIWYWLLKFAMVHIYSYGMYPFLLFLSFPTLTLIFISSYLYTTFSNYIKSLR